MTAADDSLPALTRTVVELERHAARAGWDGPVRVFALVLTQEALRRDPSLAGRLPPDTVNAAQRDAGHLTSVEQEGLPDAGSLDELLGGIAWPATVDGAAVVVERIVVPPAAEADLPEDEDEALAVLREHPARSDVRLVAAVLRDGSHACALRSRDHDTDDRVAVGADLVPGLVVALSATFH